MDTQKLNTNTKNTKPLPMGYHRNWLSCIECITCIIACVIQLKKKIYIIIIIISHFGNSLRNQELI